VLLYGQGAFVLLYGLVIETGERENTDITNSIFTAFKPVGVSFTDAHLALHMELLH